MPDYITDPDLLAQLNGGGTKAARGAPIDFEAALKAEGVTGRAADVARSIYQQESGGGRNTKTSNAGAVGGMQIIPATFASVADKGWDIADPMLNARAGIRYVKQGFDAAGGDPALTGAFYYGGPGGLAKARQGVAVSDPRNPNAPTTLQYGQQVASRIPKERGMVQRVVEGLIPSAQAATPPRQYIDDPDILAQLNATDAAAPPADVPRVEVRGTAADDTSNSPLKPLTTGERVMKGVVDPVAGGAQLLTNALPRGVVKAGDQFNNWLADKTGLVARLPEDGVDQQVRDSEIEYEARRRAGAADPAKPGIDWARLGGNLISPANLAIAARSMGLAGTANTMGRAALASAGTGGASAALAPVVSGETGDFAAEKAKQVGLGAGAGAVGGVAANALGRLISPNASTNAQNALLRTEGVRQTIGQTLGGWANNLEQRATSIPILGDAISGARRVAQDDLRKAAQNRVTVPIGAAPATETGVAGTAAISGKVDDAYDAARSAMGAFRIDQQGAQELQNVRQMVSSLAPTEQAKFQSVWNTIRQDISPNGTIDAKVFKRLDSKLGQEATTFQKSQDGYQQQLGDAFAELRRVIQESGGRANPQAAKLFGEANEAFANLVRVQKATTAAAAQDGAFTPGQLTQAVRGADQSVRKNAVATGDALMQDLSGAGNRLSNTVPDSGTAGRTFVGLGALATGAINPLLPVGIAGASLGYTQPAQTMLRYLASIRPQGAQAVRNSIGQAAPALGAPAAQIAIEARK